MGFYDDMANVEAYMSMAEGYEGGDLIEVLRQYLPDGASVLELGMGPGKDLDILKNYYKVIGTDASQLFIDLYKKTHPDVGVMVLDAVTLAINQRFDGIYTNKVLQHLTSEELNSSILKQAEILKDEGLVFHSFWYGKGEEDYEGLRFVYYTEMQLKKAFNKSFEVVRLHRYTEMEANDSIFIIGKKKS